MMRLRSPLGHGAKAIAAAAIGVALLAAAPRGPAATLELSLEGEWLSVNSESASLEVILRELARQTGLSIHLPNAVAGKEVQLTFSRLPLERGIRRILAGTSYTFTYEAGSSGHEPRLAEVHVLATGAGGGSAINLAGARAERLGFQPSPAPATAHPSPETQQLVVAALRAPDPADRIEALDVLIDSHDEVAVASTLVSAIRDPNPQVRAMALSLMDQVDPAELPIEAVAAVALGDKDLQVRKSALRLLASHFPFDAAHGYLQRAEGDPNPEVSALGKQLIIVHGR